MKYSHVISYLPLPHSYNNKLGAYNATSVCNCMWDSGKTKYFSSSPSFLFREKFDRIRRYDDLQLPYEYS